MRRIILDFAQISFQNSDYFVLYLIHWIFLSSVYTNSHRLDLDYGVLFYKLG